MFRSWFGGFDSLFSWFGGVVFQEYIFLLGAQNHENRESKPPNHENREPQMVTNGALDLRDGPNRPRQIGAWCTGPATDSALDPKSPDIQIFYLFIFEICEASKQYGSIRLVELVSTKLAWGHNLSSEPNFD